MVQQNYSFTNYKFSLNDSENNFNIFVQKSRYLGILTKMEIYNNSVYFVC